MVGPQLVVLLGDGERDGSLACAFEGYVFSLDPLSLSCYFLATIR
jgi:hypothetical protein